MRDKMSTSFPKPTVVNKNSEILDISRYGKMGMSLGSLVMDSICALQLSMNGIKANARLFSSK